MQLITPLQGFSGFTIATQGVALRYVITPFQGCFAMHLYAPQK
jgi:hypothetical protein